MSGNAPARDLTASNPAFDGNPKYSPDGKYIAYLMQKQPGYESDLFRLAIYDRAVGTSRDLTESFTNWVQDFQWASDSKSIFFTAPEEGDNPIFQLLIDTGAIRKLLTDRTIDSFFVAPDNRRHGVCASLRRCAAGTFLGRSRRQQRHRFLAAETFAFQ